MKASRPISPILTVDVAHPPRRPDLVEGALQDALEEVRRSATLRVLKVIHGYGSHGKGGSTREVVRNWAFRARRCFLGVIVGEECTLVHPKMQELRHALGEISDEDLKTENPGLTVLWVK